MSMRQVIVLVFFVAISSCAPLVKQYYPGHFSREKHSYQNNVLGFSLTYRGAWEITTDPNKMSIVSKDYAKELHTSGAELLFSGATVENTQGTRCIVVNLNETCEEYSEEIRRANQDQIDSDSGCALDTVNGIPFVVWRYSKNEFDFVEYFFTIDTYDIRLAFWTKPRIFNKFLPVYREIMGTLSREGK
jgi:hypothetical protein